MKAMRSQRRSYQPSERARAAFNRGKAWDLMQKIKDKPAYNPEDTPHGVINLSGAVNILMRDWMEAHAEPIFTPGKVHELLPYGTISGSPELLRVMADFFNAFFHPSIPVCPSHVVATNGVTSMIDLIAWTLCDPGDAILFPTPTFYMLDYDLALRNDVACAPFSTSKLSNPFGDDEESTKECIQIMETAADLALSRGNRPRVLFLCNPANPQGRSYPSGLLQAMARFCAKRQMHLVADEIYALSQFGDKRFDSVLGIRDEPQFGVDTSVMVHFIYGISKDFDMGGLRMGFLASRNVAVTAAIKRVTWFTWISRWSEAFVTEFFSRLDLVHDYVSLYQQRLSATYCKASEALAANKLPFQPATSGLFVLLDLSGWIHHFCGPDRDNDPEKTREGQLCNYLVDNGVFINPGQFALSDVPGQFRLVFTETPVEYVVLAAERIRKALETLPAAITKADFASPEDAATLCGSESEDPAKVKPADTGEIKACSTARYVRNLVNKLNCFV